MPVLTPQRALLIGFIVAPILFGLSAYFTHANGRRILAAFIGNLMAFAPGLIPVMVDGILFATCQLLVQMTQRLIAGSANIDPLRA